MLVLVLALGLALALALVLGLVAVFVVFVFVLALVLVLVSVLPAELRERAANVGVETGKSSIDTAERGRNLRLAGLPVVACAALPSRLSLSLDATPAEAVQQGAGGGPRE